MIIGIMNHETENHSRACRTTWQRPSKRLSQVLHVWLRHAAADEVCKVRTRVDVADPHTNFQKLAHANARWPFLQTDYKIAQSRLSWTMHVMTIAFCRWFRYWPLYRTIKLTHSNSANDEKTKNAHDIEMPSQKPHTHFRKPDM
eukprot:scaffold278330_cov28-Tisochrysis_lutea.AAC.2